MRASLREIVVAVIEIGIITLTQRVSKSCRVGLSTAESVQYFIRQQCAQKERPASSCWQRNTAAEQSGYPSH